MNTGTAQRPVAAKPRGSLKTWIRRQRFNLFPAFWGTGAKVIYMAEDLRAIRIKLPLNFRTKNIYGTLFGGAMYAARTCTRRKCGKERHGNRIDRLPSARTTIVPAGAGVGRNH